MRRRTRPGVALLHAAAHHVVLGLGLTVLVLLVSAIARPQTGRHERSWALTPVDPASGEYIVMREVAGVVAVRRGWTRAGRWHFPQFSDHYDFDPRYVPSLERRGDRRDWSVWGSFGPHDAPAHESAYGLEEARGWPFLATWCALELARDGRAGRVRGGIALNAEGAGRPAGALRILPLRPIWGGLVGNVAFFGVASFAITAGLRWIRGRARANRGRCPACGYDLQRQPAPGCPECGWGRT